jgi:tetratricopeptide (TPR) repeat protein
MYAATLGEAYNQMLQYDLARENLELAAKSARSLNGEEHVDTIETEARLGNFYCQVFDFKEGLAHLKHARDVCLKTKGLDDPFYTPQMSIMYGQALADSGRLEEGLVLISQAVENRRKNRPGTQYLAHMLSIQALVLADLGDYKKAARNLEEAEKINAKVGSTKQSAYTLARLKVAYASNNLSEASAVIESGYGPLAERDQLSLGLLRSLLSRAELSLFKGNPADAERLSVRASELVTASRMRSYLKFWEVRSAMAQGNAYLLLHQAQKALPLFQRAAKLTSEMYNEKSVHRLPSQAALGMVYSQLGDIQMAKKYLAQADYLRSLHPQLGEQFERPVRILREIIASR